MEKYERLASSSDIIDATIPTTSSKQSVPALLRALGITWEGYGQNEAYIGASS